MIDSQVFQRLQAIGLTTRVLQQLGTQVPPDERFALLRVTEVQRDGVTLHDGEHPWRARVMPALLHQLQDAGDALAVGDWVLAEPDAHQAWWVHVRVPPLNQIARRLHDGRDKVTRVVLVSNIDTALLVMGLDQDFNLRRLERYLALAQLTDVGAVVVLTKADLCPDAAARRAEVEAILPPAAAVVCVNALSDQTRVVLAPWLGAGQTLALLGSSGAGKSTLTNCLAGAALQHTGANRADDSRGRHTTTARTLHAVAGSACIIDTPGLRTLRLDSEAGAVGAVFDDIARLATHCRFRDCQHQEEPGCAVRDGVSGERLRSFHKLMRESRRDAQTALERKAQVAVWKARGRFAKAISKGKRG